LIHAELNVVDRPAVYLTRDSLTSAGAWSRVQEAMGRGVIGGDRDRVEVRVDVFLAELEALRDLRDIFAEAVNFGPRLREQLQSLLQERRARDGIPANKPISPDQLENELAAAGFIRSLKTFQLRNLARISQLPHSADFSVPGAGKTTVALANFALARHRSIVKRALVVAPIAAFDAWKEDSKECLHPDPLIVIHQGVGSIIPADADIVLTNYNRVAADYDRLRKFVSEAPTQIILDEAHRIKRGSDGVHGRAVLDMAYAAKRRDVLTGTPAPQSAHDLIALIMFLYPGQDREILPERVYDDRLGRDSEVLNETSAAIQRYFVRTTKTELRLPKPEFLVERGIMGPLQQAIYAALLGRYRGTFALETSGRREFDRLGRVMMYLLEAATNPMLLTAGSDKGDDPTFIHPPIELRGDEPLLNLLSSYHRHETPWKYQRIKEIVASAASRGEKVLIWSSFVRNLKVLSKHLSEFCPAIVHGGVPSIEEPAPIGILTRERELGRFKTDPRCTVLLANPAACGEGISLHHWCHHAIFVDRTFNAGQFLQSQDRIHRLGLSSEVVTRFTLLISTGTIDEVVDGRLREKVGALSALMKDPALVRLALPDIEEGSSIANDLVQGDEDVQSVLSHICDASQ